MIVWLCFACAWVTTLACRCAPLASCVQLGNGSLGCVCPYFGDGYNSCSDQRFVTKATVRTQQDLKPWIEYLGSTLEVLSQQSVDNTIQYVLELDSTNYEAMLDLTQRVNLKNWPHKVALLGSATSRIVSNIQFQEEPPLLELIEISFNESWWDIEFAKTEGFFFLSNSVVPIPCIHFNAPCCIRSFLSADFSTGVLDTKILANCSRPSTNTSQNLAHSTNDSALRSHILWSTDSILLRLHETELNIIAQKKDSIHSFSAGLLKNDDVTQITILLDNQFNVTNYSIGSFTRQVTNFIMMQVETIGPQVVLHVYAQSFLENASIAFLQYAWSDMEWIQPSCDQVRQCITLASPCQGTVTDGVIEFYVPISNYSAERGNVTIYFVLQRGQNLARVMTQSAPTIMTRQCDNDITVTDEVQIQVLQGLTQTEIYKGFSKPILKLNVEPQTDTLITLIARTLSGIAIKNLQAIHTTTEEERFNISTNRTCVTCIVEQLVLDERVVSPRSCFYFGTGDEVAWIEAYIGLVGSSLGLQVLEKIPNDVKVGSAAAVFINPVWPWPNATLVSEITYLKATFGKPTTHSTHARRLLQQDTMSRQSRLQKPWFLVVVASIIWLAYYILVHFFEN
jgi:hypothetical protein